MNREGVIITSFLIERQRQVKLFQVRLPREVKNVIGIEMGFTWISGVPPIPVTSSVWVLPMEINRNLVLGDLKLQSYEKANVFYTTELSLNNNCSSADFTSAGFKPQPFTHQNKANEDNVNVDGSSTILQGVFRDKLADQLQGNYSYTVRVYVWCEAKIDQTT